MKSIVFTCLGLALASVSAQTASQPAGPAGKVAVIYFQGAIVGTKDGQKAAAELDSKAAPKRKELEVKQNEMNTLQDQFNKGQNTLSEAAKNELYKNIELKKKAYQREMQVCDRKYRNESGTMYISFTAFCRAEVAQRYSQKALKGR